MSEPSTPGDEELSPSREARLDDLCDRFEAAWKAGERPVIEEFVAQVAESDRSVVLAELIALDIEFRKRLGESATPEDYNSRLGLSSAAGPATVASEISLLLPPESPGTNPLSPRPMSRGEGQTAACDADTPVPIGGAFANKSPTPRGGTDFSNAPATSNIGSSESTFSPSACPDIAGYRILSELGRGGMGIVYKARHLALDRVVALKMLLAGGFANPRELSRFRIEAEAVARLHHPGIVQIYEIGDHHSLPFFTLEFVEGGSLGLKLGRSPQTPRFAAELVRALALAVHYAHQRGVLHRDLKPGNILLTTDGSPKITDFGLAKQLGKDSLHTHTGDIVGTPSYMAPEQAAGKPKETGVWTDVYALGAILYEMLVGKPPFKGETLFETLDLVCNTEPVRPAHFQPSTPLDLEVICLKCLAKEPGKRYASADALAEDLRRFLEREPIQARPSGKWERAVKWCRRRPTAAALILLGTLTLIGAVSGALTIARLEYLRAEEANRLRAEANRERVHAEQNFQNARDAVDSLLTGLSRDRLVYEPRMEKVRRDFLHQALFYYNRFLTTKSDLPEVRWEAGRASTRVGDIHELLGEDAEAEKAYQSALGLLESLATESPDKSEYRHDLAVVHTNRGNLLKKTGRLSEAEISYQQALVLFARLVKQQPEAPWLRRELAGAHANRASVLQARNLLSESDSDYQSAEKLLDALVAESRVPEYRDDLARCLNNHGAQRQKAGQASQAEQYHRQALGLFAELIKQHPQVPGYRQQHAVSLVHLGNLQRDTNVGKAETSFKEALAVRKQLAADFPSIPAYRQELAEAYMSLAVLQGAGRKAEADQMYLQGLQVKAQLVHDFPTVPDFRRDLAVAHSSWAILLQTHGRLAEANKAYEETLSQLTRLIDEYPALPDYRQEEASTLINFGTLQQMMSQPEDAEKSYARALEVRKQLADQFGQLPDYRQELARAYLNLGTLQQINGQFPRAESAYREALGVLEKLVKSYPSVPDYRHELAVSYNNLGNLLQATNRTKEAEQTWRDAVALLARMSEEMPKVPIYRQEQARTLNQLAILLAATARGADAEATWNQALKLQEALVKETPDKADCRLELARTHGNLAILQLGSNPPDKALTSFDRAIELLEPMAKNPATASQAWQELGIHHFNRASLLEQLGRDKDAEQSWQRAETVQRALVKRAPKAPEYQAALAQTLTAHAYQLLKAGKRDEARGSLESALGLYQTAVLLNPDPRYRQSWLECTVTLVELHLEAKVHAAAVRTVVDATKNGLTKVNERIRLSELLARTIPLVEKDADVPEARRKMLAREYGDQAMVLLRQAIADGYQDVKHLKQSADLAPLRSRDDFQRLLEKPSPS